MGFFDELKELGRGIKEVGQELGRDLSKIAVETKDEIKNDPVKFLSESAVDVAKAGVAIGKGVCKVAPQVIEAGLQAQQKKLDELGKKD